jgi:hypothetical protein
MTRAIVLLSLAGAGLAACASVPEPPAAAPGAACTVTPLADLIGAEGNVALATDAMARSGARIMRWTRPGMAVTMDYRADRLTITLDDEGRVQRFDCG